MTTHDRLNAKKNDLKLSQKYSFWKSTDADNSTIVKDELDPIEIELNTLREFKTCLNYLFLNHRLVAIASE